MALVEKQLVAQTGAAARLHRDPQLEVVATLLVEQALDLRRGVRCDLHTICGCGLLRAAGFLDGHQNSPELWFVPPRSRRDARCIPCPPSYAVAGTRAARPSSQYDQVRAMRSANALRLASGSDMAAFSPT